jgi:hypothetical protein
MAQVWIRLAQEHAGDSIEKVESEDEGPLTRSHRRMNASWTNARQFRTAGRSRHWVPPDRKTQDAQGHDKADFTPLRRRARMLYPITSAAYPYPTLAPENFAAMAVPLGRPAMPRVSTMCERARK